MQERKVVVLGWWVVAVLVLAGCKVEAVQDGDGEGGGSLDLGDLQEQAEEVIDEARELEICPGQTLEELFEADALSDECREALLSFLPEPETSFESTLVAPGGLRDVEGQLRLLLQGADSEGVALDVEAWAALEVWVSDGDGERMLEQGEYALQLAADLPSDLLAIAVVNDYSASMLEGDIRDVAEVETELFECLPPIHETQVLRFSAEVHEALAYSSDGDAIAGALAHDEGFDRGTTALLDALGVGAQGLSSRERPVRILVLSTDGGENASTMFTQPEVLAALDEHGVFVLALGALLADVDFMRDVTDGRGVFFYTREFSALADAAAPYLDSIKALTELRIDVDPPPQQVRLVHAELEATFSLE